MSSGNAFRNQQFNPYSTVSLALQVPVFNGLGRLNAVKQAEIQYKELQLNRENVESSLRMQVRLALDNIDKEVRQIASSEEGVRQAAKANEIMQKKLRDRERPHISTSADAELANTSAQLAYLQAIYNYLVSTKRTRHAPPDARTLSESPATIPQNKTHSIKSTHEKQCIFPLLAILVLAGCNGDKKKAEATAQSETVPTVRLGPSTVKP